LFVENHTSSSASNGVRGCPLKLKPKRASTMTKVGARRGGGGAHLSPGCDCFEQCGTLDGLSPDPTKHSGRACVLRTN
jgi:hypothetical protein